MRSIRFFLIATGFTLLLSSCSVFKPKYGCGDNGKNVGAEKLLSGEQPRKTPKFKA